MLSTVKSMITGLASINLKNGKSPPHRKPFLRLIDAKPVIIDFTVLNIDLKSATKIFTVLNIDAKQTIIDLTVVYIDLNSFAQFLIMMKIDVKSVMIDLTVFYIDLESFLTVLNIDVRCTTKTLIVPNIDLRSATKTFIILKIDGDRC